MAGDYFLLTWTRCYGLFNRQWRIGGELAKVSTKFSKNSPNLDSTYSQDEFATYAATAFRASAAPRYARLDHDDV